MGLCGMIDPVRPEVVDAIAECREAGIRPIMITGDHIDTAVAIAKELGILTDGSEAITGAQLNEMSDEEFEQKFKNISVYARVQPEDTDGAPFINWASGTIPVTTINTSYQVQYVIERLCTADVSIPVALPVPATMDRAADRCHTTTADPGGSKKGGGAIQPDMPVAVMYKVTVRVTGPRNATSITQTILSL